MNDKIRALEKQLADNETIKENLDNTLLSAWYELLMSCGIEKGKVVSVKSYGDKIEKGIFTSLYFKYNNIKAEIMKIKKDGTAHPTATIYCYQLSDIQELKAAR